MESRETHDYVRESKDMDQVEVEEMSFVPSEISVHQQLLCRHSQSNENFFQHLVVCVDGDERRPAMLQQVFGGRTEHHRQNGSGVSLLRKKRIVEGCET